MNFVGVTVSKRETKNAGLGSKVLRNAPKDSRTETKVYSQVLTSSLLFTIPTTPARVILWCVS